MKTRVNLEFGYAESSGPNVEIGDRLVPSTIDVHFESVDGQPKLHLVIDSSSGAPKCADLRVSAADGGREVRTKDVRAVEIDSWIEAIVPLFAMQIVERGKKGAVAAVINTGDAEAYAKAKRTLNAAKRVDRRKVNRDLLERVAKTYRDSGPPRDGAIQRAFGVSESTAFRYIREARKQGLLEERED